MNDPAREHLMLTVLGTGPRETTYRLDTATASASVASAALYELLREADRPDRILALCTPEAERESLPMLEERLARWRCPVEVVQISSDPGDHAIQTCLAGLSEKVPTGVDLTVDVTHGLRHLAFVAYAGVLYLTALRGVRLRAAYYGMLGGEVSPFFDVRPLVELPQWFHAVRVLKDTGSAHVMADLVTASGQRDAQPVGHALRLLAEAYASGLPVELGYLSGQFLDMHAESLRRILRAQRLPLAGELVRDFTDSIADQRLGQDLPETGWKAAVCLDRTELARQAGIIDGYLARGNYPTAFELMREWLVLWAMCQTGRVGGWLKYKKRLGAEALLHRLADMAEKCSPSEIRTDDQMAVGQAWGHLRKLRNWYAHHGLDKAVTLSTEGELAQHVAAVVPVWRTLLRAVPEVTLRFPLPDGRLLVSPIGMRPGVLYSALLAADPGRVTCCLVICSAESKGAAMAACQAANYSGTVEFLHLDDPFAGVAELDRRVEEAKRYVSNAGEVFVNVTGGTTLMGVLAERIASQARRDRSLHRFALIDRRSPAEQEADPYQRGEVCWLEPAGSGRQ